MSDILMCPVCCKIYHKDRINKERAFCPDLECWGGGMFELFEIDELMIEPIRILNYKEYITKFCCSGHSYSSSKRAYISFHNEIRLPSIPKGWKLCRDNTIEVDDCLFNNEVYKNLIDWCDSLKRYGESIEEENWFIEDDVDEIIEQEDWFDEDGMEEEFIEGNDLVENEFDVNKK